MSPKGDTAPLKNQEIGHVSLELEGSIITNFWSPVKMLFGELFVTSASLRKTNWPTDQPTNQHTNPPTRKPPTPFEQDELSAAGALQNTAGNTKARYLSCSWGETNLGLTQKVVLEHMRPLFLCVCIFLVRNHSKTMSISLSHAYLGATLVLSQGQHLQVIGLGCGILTCKYHLCGGRRCWWIGWQNKLNHFWPLTGGIEQNKAAFCGISIYRSTKSLHDILVALTYDRYCKSVWKIHALENRCFFRLFAPPWLSKGVPCFQCWNLIRKLRKGEPRAFNVEIYLENWEMPPPLQLHPDSFHGPNDKCRPNGPGLAS